MEVLERRFYDVQQLSAAIAAVPVTCTCGAVAILVRPISAQIVQMADTVCTQSHSGSDPDRC